MSSHACGDDAFAGFPLREVEQSIPARFRRQVEDHRDCVAVVDDGRTLTYGELDAWSSGVATLLLRRRGRGFEPVGLQLRQGPAAVAGILGVLKAGKGYVPLDPDDPPERRQRVVDAVGAGLVLDAADVEGADPDADPGVDVSPDDVAYVFFTSGSTGAPKGVFDCHRNVLHNVLRYTRALEIRPADRLTLLQAPAYSGSVSSLFCALLNGATVFPFRPAGATPARLADWLLDGRLTVYHSVPSIFRTLCSDGRAFPDVRVVRLEGDRATGLDVELFRTRFGPGSLLANGLGITETGLVRQLRLPHGASAEEGILPVGYAVDDVDVVILNESGREAPPGAAGEIGVRSRYLALGYWGRPDLTADAFRADGGDGVRTYRTGDMGRLRPDGCLEYLGRRDFGLKVLGNRVEPAEVESELVRLPEVAEALVTTLPGRRGEGRLVAYVVPAEAGALPSVVELRRMLAERLPAYMIPGFVTAVGALPLGPNGKLDPRALAALEDARPAAEPPLDDHERELVQVCSEVLEYPVGRSDDLFELGLDSLAAAEILGEVEKRYGVSLRGSTLLERRTVAGLAEAIREGPRTPGDAVVLLRPGAGATPLFLVHDQYGSVLLYAQLARRLPESIPVYGLQGAGRPGFGTIEERAAELVQSVRAVQPGGPYRLGGFCFGGVVAFEMARQLAAAGERLGPLVLVGVTAWDFRLVSGDAWQRYLEWAGVERVRARTGRHLRRMQELGLVEGARHALRTARSVPGYVRVRRGRRWIQSPPTDGWVDACQAAFSTYRPRRHAGRAVLLLSSESTERYSTDPQADWAGLADAVEVHVLPGSDHALLASPVVDELAAHVAAALGEALPAAAPS